MMHISFPKIAKSIEAQIEDDEDRALLSMGTKSINR